MKIKSIIACGALLLSVGAATTSCEDMFTAENKLVTENLTPQDTVYQVMGIIQRMQKLADRTVLLGELRADLVDVDAAHANVHLQELGNNNVSEDNIYNQPADYYAVINNCNIYLNYVDSLLLAYGDKPLPSGNNIYYKKEIIGVKTFRAWCYLELAKIYGEVPLVTEPVLTSNAAEQILASGQKADLQTIADFCINDLKGYAFETENNNLRPSYSSNYANYFIPVRVMLAELYLWRGSVTGSEEDYINAVRMYHDFLAFPKEERPTGEYDVAWSNINHTGWSTSYSINLFRNSATSRSYVGVIPVDTTEYNGNVSDLRAVFNPTYKNNYYPQVTIAGRLDSISRSQDYCLFMYESATNYGTFYISKDPTEFTSQREIGDLRLQDMLYIRSINDKYNSAFNPEAMYIAKYTGGSSYTSTDQRLAYVPYYRVNTLYLHMAEALNRAGLPETAFAVLKYGLTEETLMNTNYISLYERNRLAQIKSYGFTNISPNYPDEYNSSFLVWSIDKFYTKDKMVDKNSPSQEGISMLNFQIGIHSMGSGDSEFNQRYVLPADSSRWVYLTYPTEPVYNKDEDPDSLVYKPAYELYTDSLQAYELQDSLNNAWLYEDSKNIRMDFVAEKILDEEAMENCFEGTRFYDLMRYVRQSGDNSKTINMPAYIEEKYGPGKTLTGKPWYLNLPKR